MVRYNCKTRCGHLRYIIRLKRDIKKPEAVTNLLPCSTQVDCCVINKHGSVKDDVHEGSSAT